MAIQTNRRVKFIVFSLLGSISLGAFFQNCANPNLVIEDLTLESKALEAERVALGKADEEVTVGLQSVPPLKMFFIVDNSGTMKENQLNLSASFGAMFDQASSDSLSKFDTTSYLISTAQKSPSFSLERAGLDSIAGKQQKFSVASLFTQSDLDSYRSGTLNSGFVPGDNIGYQLIKTESPTRYNFQPAMVLGVQESQPGQLSWKSSIRKLASESPQKMESEFKTRLSVLDSGRIPLELMNGVYRPEHSTVVDSESGLCSVARILRNPNSYIQSGDLLSFVIVSDENDNDPKGESCVQGYSRYSGNEDLYDVNCVRSESSVETQTTSLVQAADTCSLNGDQGYNFSFEYSVTKYQTAVKYKNYLSRAKYSTPRTNVSYKAKVISFEYPQTDISYYVQTCVDVISDGLAVGKKCSIGDIPVQGSKTGDFKNTCFDLAKQLNPNAVDIEGRKPVCTVSSRPIASCDPVNDLKCKKVETLISKEMRDVLGTFSSTQCLAQAKTDVFFDTSSTPTCVVGTPLVSEAACTAVLETAGCKKIAEPVYGQGVATVAMDVTTGTSCVDWVKGNRPDHAVASSADVVCSLSSSVTPAAQTLSILFKETASVDGGKSLPVGDCGALKSIALTKARMLNAKLSEADVCRITGYSRAATTTSLKSPDKTCQMLAEERCIANNLRSCTSSLNIGATTSVASSPLLVKKVQERLSCSSKCSDSKLDACNSDPTAADLTIAQYLQKIYGPTATCKVSVVDLPMVYSQKTGVTVGEMASFCKPSMEGIPTYSLRTKGPYRSIADDVDYVAGTVKDPNTGVLRPKMDLIEYIKTRSAELSQISPIFSSIVRLPVDSSGKGGSVGSDYLKLVGNGSAGQVESVLSKDYSVVLKDLGKVLKTKLDKSFVLQKMKAHQIITHVFLQPQGEKANEVEISASQWIQSGTTLTLDEKLEYKDGDKFRIEFQNYIKKTN